MQGVYCVERDRAGETGKFICQTVLTSKLGAPITAAARRLARKVATSLQTNHLVQEYIDFLPPDIQRFRLLVY